MINHPDHQKLDQNRDQDRLDALESRLQAARSSDNSQPEHTPRMGGPAMRVAIDFVAAVAVGVILGLALDYWFGFGPWGLIIFFILGAGAGMMNVYKIAAGHDMAVGYRHDQTFSEEKEPSSHQTHQRK